MVLVPMILSLSVHEFAHAWSAYKLGDDTAASQGRMTLNPLSHIDVFGTLIIPIFSVLNGGFSLIGWAKPVPVSPFRFHRNISMRSGMIITALAGPASNLILATLLAGVSMFLYSEQINSLAPHVGGSRVDALMYLGAMLDGNPIPMLLNRIFVMNVFLALFNMLPVPPLDGSRVLPLDVQEKMARYTMVVFIAFLILINVAGGILWIPARVISNILLGFWGIFV